MNADRSPRAFRFSPVLVLLVGGTFGLFASSASAQSYVFGRLDLVTPRPALDVITADFNGDGRLDLGPVKE
jgi:hypothetical protein